MGLCFGAGSIRKPEGSSRIFKGVSYTPQQVRQERQNDQAFDRKVVCIIENIIKKST
jgi:hypothetical protein